MDGYMVPGNKLITEEGVLSPTAPTNTSNIICWVHLVQGSTATNTSLTLYKYASTLTAAANRITLIDVAPGQRSNTVYFGDGYSGGLLCDKGCYMQTGTGFSWANICYRTSNI